MITATRPLVASTKGRRECPDTLRRIVRFLGVEASDEAVAAAVEACELQRMRKQYPRAGAAFFRKGGVNAGRQAFSDAQRRMVLSVSEPLLEKFDHGSQ